MCNRKIPILAQKALLYTYEIAFSIKPHHINRIIQSTPWCFISRCPVHEKIVGDLAKDMGFTHVSISSETMPMVRIVPRGYTGRVSRCLLIFRSVHILH